MQSQQVNDHIANFKLKCEQNVSREYDMLANVTKETQHEPGTRSEEHQRWFHASARTTGQRVLQELRPPVLHEHGRQEVRPLERRLQEVHRVESV